MAGIYIHVPFCKQACIYCNFHFKAGNHNTQPLVEAIAKELVIRKKEASEWGEIQTIYFGGGTPSLLSLNQLNLLLDVIHQHFILANEVECTLEANPEDLSLEYCRDIKQLGINRLSVGIQTFHEEGLRWMNRIHNAETAKQAIAFAQTAGIQNISLDLISGIPNLGSTHHIDDLKLAVSLNPTHLSIYSLTLEPNTTWERLIKHKNYPVPVESQQAKAFEESRDFLDERGWLLYEISNTALNEKFVSKHNSAYWEGKPYLGVGPSAHSFDGKFRRWNLNNHTHYCEQLSDNKDAPHEKEEITPIIAFNEAIMTGLRQQKGVSLNVLNKILPAEVPHLLQQIQNPFKEHFIIENERFRLKKESLLFADSLSASLFIVD